MGRIAFDDLPWALRWLIRAILVTIMLNVICSCAAFYPTPPYPSPLGGEDLSGLAEVDTDVFRSSQPNEQQTKMLRDKYHVTDIFKLDHWYEGEDHQIPGITVHYFALDPLTVTWSQFERAYAAIEQAHKSGKVVLWHCAIGRDRTGVMQFAWDVRHGIPVDVAYAHMMRMGFHPYPRLWTIVTRIASW